jgi:predicted CXXCH cytochrome family protein
VAEDRNRPGYPNRQWLKWVSAVILLTGVMVYFYYVYPGRGVGPAQPIAFSHRVHAGVKAIHCRFCHPQVERSAHAGLPEVEKCFYCHNYIIPSHPEILKEKGYLDRQRPVPWVRVFYVPDFVKFRHEPHLRWGKLECSQCHGPVAQMDRLQTRVFKMQFCIDCHKQKKAQLDCWLACHH